LKRKGKIVFLIVLAGGVLGAILGYVLRDIVPILNQGLKVGTDRLNLNLYLFDVSFSIHINITLAAIIGILLAFLLADVGRRK
jgi:undecaprenyl pyrophosphate phosphatase UppP